MTDEIEVTPGQTNAEPPQDDAASTPVAEAPVAARPLSEIVPEVLAETPAETPAEEPAESASATPEPDAELEAEAAGAEEVAPSDTQTAAAAPVETPEPELEPVVVAQPAATWWPFAVYGALWLVFAGLLGWLLYSAPAGVPSVEAPYYPYLVMAGVALTLVGPVLAVVLYVGAKDAVVSVPGLFATLLLRAASMTLAGVALWWIVLIAADAVRLGRLL